MVSWKPELIKYGDAVGLRLGDGPGRRLKEFVSKPDNKNIGRKCPNVDIMNLKNAVLIVTTVRV